MFAIIVDERIVRFSAIPLLNEDCRVVEDDIAECAPGEILDLPSYTVEPDRVIRRRCAVQARYGDLLTRCHTARSEAYPRIGDQLDAVMRGFAALLDGSPLPEDVRAWVTECQAVKERYRKPPEPSEDLETPAPLAA